MRRDERQMQKSALATKIAADEWAKKMKEAQKNKVYFESDIQVYEEVDVQSEATTSEAAACESTDTFYPAFSDVVTISDSDCDVEVEASNESVQTPTSSSKSASYFFPTADQELPAIEEVHDKSRPVIQSGGEDEVPGAVKQKTEPCLSVDAIKESDELVHFYTGLETYDVFLHAFWSLGDNVNHLKYAYSKGCKCLSTQNQFLLMLVKLRQYSSHSELARMFQVSEFTVQNVFVTWVNFCHFQWKEVDWWPERDLVSHYCPTDFKRKFPSTPVIVDATEIRINMLSDPKSQKASFSSYKHGSTMKVLVGVTPGGLTLFVSDAWWF